MAGYMGITGFSEPTNSDMDRWTKSLDDLLAEPKGLYHFKKFLSGLPNNQGDLVHIVGIWECCDQVIKSGTQAISEDDKQAILDGAQRNLNITSCKKQLVEDINSGNGAQIMEAVKIVKKAARNELNVFYSEFKNYLRPVNSRKCTIL